MKKFGNKSFNKLVKRQSPGAIVLVFIAVMAIGLISQSVAVTILSLFTAGLFLLYQAFAGKRMRRQFTVASLLCLALAGILWVSFPDGRVVLEQELQNLTSEPEEKAVDVDSPSPQSEQSIDTSSQSELYQVDRVTDGDTIRVLIGSESVVVRFIGIDTPEVYGGVECYGREASNRMKELVEGGRVRLETDPSQGDVDRYDRILRFVFTESGENVGEVMLREGYAREYTYNKPYKYLDEFIQAEADAKHAQVGLWSSSNC